jgi:geranylgeranyl pyrophosphate synthase
MQFVDLHPELAALLRQVEALTRSAWEDEDHFLGKAARRALLGQGKRLRPAILLLAAECSGGATEHSVALASVTEVVHAASLVHDDVIDRAASRRGCQSANAVWGNKVSVLLGDYLIARAIDLLPPGGRERFLPQLAEVARRMCMGQTEEILASGRRLSAQEYLDIVRLKTASLFGFCGRVGAQTGGGSPEVAGALGLFGEAFGVAFQLADDILDFVGCDGRSGKPEGGDLAERKCTLPLIIAAERGGDAVSATLEGLIGGGGPPEGHLEAARGVAEPTGAIECAWDEVRGWLREAREHLSTSQCR